MKYFIIIFLFFLFYFITIKDIYDSNKYLTEDVRILERDLGERDSLIIKLKYTNAKLIEEIEELKKVKIDKKPKLKPIIKQETIQPIENKTTENDTLL